MSFRFVIGASIVAAAALAGCNREGVCVTSNPSFASSAGSCLPRVQASLCEDSFDGTWHAYEDGDGDLGISNGGRTCSALGFSEVDSTGNAFHRPSTGAR